MKTSKRVKRSTRKIAKKVSKKAVKKVPVKKRVKKLAKKIVTVKKPVKRVTPVVKKKEVAAIRKIAKEILHDTPVSEVGTTSVTVTPEAKEASSPSFVITEKVRINEGLYNGNIGYIRQFFGNGMFAEIDFISITPASSILHKISTLEKVD